MLPLPPPQTIPPANDPAAVPFEERSVTLPSGAYRYRVFVPKIRARGGRPAILFLHGSGERGDDNAAQTKNGVRLMIALKENGGPARFPAIVVAPQCRAEGAWRDPDMKAMALAALDAAVEEFGGDPHRRYLTGLSLGGYGTWAYAADEPGRWAAIAPVCGGVRFPDAPRLDPNVPNPYSAVARTLAAARLPAWIFHGDADPAVPVGESRSMAAALLARGADVRYSEYPGVGHASWDLAYADPKLLPWMLSHRR